MKGPWCAFELESPVRPCLPGHRFHWCAHLKLIIPSGTLCPAFRPACVCSIFRSPPCGTPRCPCCSLAPRRNQTYQASSHATHLRILLTSAHMQQQAHAAHPRMLPTRACSAITSPETQLLCRQVDLLCTSGCGSGVWFKCRRRPDAWRHMHIGSCVASCMVRPCWHGRASGGAPHVCPASRGTCTICDKRVLGAQVKPACRLSGTGQ